MKIFKRLLVFFIVVAVTFCIFSSKVNQNCMINNEESIKFTEGWSLYINNDLISSDVNLPSSVDAHANDTVTIINKLPAYFTPGMTIKFRSSQQFVDVKIDNEVIYRYGYEKEALFGKAPGSIWNLIRMPDDAEAKEIAISLKSPYEIYSSTLPEVDYGSKISLVYGIAYDHIFSVIMGSFFILIAGALLLINLFTPKNNKKSTVRYLGFFSLLAGIWTIIESKMLQFFINNQIMGLYISIISIMIMPILFLTFVKNAYPDLNKKLINTLTYTLATVTLLILLLQILNVSDIINIIKFYHIFLIISVIVFSVHFYTVVKSSKSKDIKAFALAYSIFIVFVICEVYNFYMKIIDNTSVFFTIGLFILIFILAVLSIKKIFKLIRENAENMIYEKLAYTDSLTSVANRTRYEEDLKKYSDLSRYDNFSVLIFDINNLKHINDTYGHSAGDECIIAACEYIQKTFCYNTKLYRIGGDEFIVIIESVDYSIINKGMHDFFDNLNSVKLSTGATLSIAGGKAFYENNINLTIHDICKKADKEMYKKKSEMKDSANNRYQR